MKRSQDQVSKDAELVAIVGMGCRWPGGVTNPSQLWDLLAEKRSGYQDFQGSDRINPKGFYHPNGQRSGCTPTQGAFLLQEDPKLFDHSFFGMTAPEATVIDPQQRKILEVVYEAFENAGEPWDNFYGSKTGVFVGNFNFDHSLMQSRDIDDASPYSATGTSVSIISNRINYALNLQGPSMTVDTACSSSLYALHWAIKAIQNGDCDSAIVAGSNLILGPDTHLLLAKLGALSPTSTCHTFDASADGYARAEGFGALYLKKVSDAVAGQYPIRAVVRGTAVNSNGKSHGLTQPNARAQEAVIRQAYLNAGLPTCQTGYFEAHGTGTPTGDPLEVSAIGRVFAADHQSEPLLIGSIKTNLGHTEAASGIAGIMKAVLAMEAEMIPATIGVKNLNPQIDFEGARVKVVTDMTPWPKGKLRRTSVNSFGFGGANAHCILDHVSTMFPDSEGIDGKKLVGRGKYDLLNSSNGSNRIHGPFNEHTILAPLNRDIIHPPNGANGIYTPNSTTGSNTPKDTNGIPALLNGNTVHALDGTYTPHEITGIKDSHAPNSKNTYLANGTITPPQDAKFSSQTRRLVLLPFTAHTESSLKSNISLTAKSLQTHSLADIAYTLSSRRSRFSHRTFLLIDSLDPSIAFQETVSTWQVTSKTKPRSIGFIFTGQGAQWEGMGASLFQYAVFRNTITELDAVLSGLTFAPRWSLKDLFIGDLGAKINEPEISQTICTALQIGLCHLFKSWGVEHVATMGHSSGEICAAYAAGLISSSEAIVAAFCRGSAVRRNRQQGQMLAVGLGVDKVEPLLSGLEDKVQIAAINSPDSVTLSGNSAAINDLAAKFHNDGIFSRLLQTGGNAYHSHQMLAVGKEYDTLLKKGLGELREKEAHYLIEDPIPFFSSVTPNKTLKSGDIGASYWRKNLESPVLFAEALECMRQLDAPQVDILVEIGPHPALKGPVKQTITQSAIQTNTKEDPYIPTLKRGEDGMRSILTTCGTLMALNAKVDLAAVNSVDSIEDGNLSYIHGHVCVDLPTYAYSYGPVLYNENRPNKEYRNRSNVRHDILGSRLPGTAKSCPSWRNILRVKDVPWLSHHKLIPNTVLPASAYICMAIEAMTQIQESEEGDSSFGYTLKDVSITSAMRIPEEGSGIEVVTSLEAADIVGTKNPLASSKFRISSVAIGTDTWTEHCSGTIVACASKNLRNRTLAAPQDPRIIDAKAWYKRFTEIGLGYGTSFQGLSDIKSNPYTNTASANLDLATTGGMFDYPESRYMIHPASLDLCHQFALIASCGGQVQKADKAFVPVFVEEVTIWNAIDTASLHGIAIAQANFRGLRGAYANIQLTNIDGSPVVDIRNLRCISYEGGNLQQPGEIVKSRTPYSKISWKPDLTALTNSQARSLFPAPVSADAVENIMFNMDRLAMFMVVEIQHRYSAVLHTTTLPTHLTRFLEWIGRCVRRPLPFAEEALGMQSSERSSIINDISGSIANPEVRLAKRIFDNLDAILREEKSGLEVALQDGLLTELYSGGLHVLSSYRQLENIIDTLAHNHPNMSILEVGAGTGGATRILMNVLHGSDDRRRYDEYTFTDISSAFFKHAQSEFSGCAGMEFKVLDLEKPPLDQGFEGSFDLVIASEVLHATRDIVEATRNVRALLKPGGKLVLLETTKEVLGHGLVLGAFPDYWTATEDYRIDGPFMSMDRWSQVLQSSGFSGIDIHLDDYPQPLTFGSILVSTAIEEKDTLVKKALPATKKDGIQLVLGSDQKLSDRLMDDFTHKGFEVSGISLASHKIPEKSRTVLIISAEDVFRLETDREWFTNFRDLVQNSASLLIVTVRARTEALSPHKAIIPGLLRVCSTENPVAKYASLDCHCSAEPTNAALVTGIVALEARVWSFQPGSLRDQEFSWIDGALHIGRLVPDPDLNADFENRSSRGSSSLQQLPIGIQGPLKVNFQTPGIMSSLFFEPDIEFLEPLKEDCIEIEVGAVGLNWKDLAVSSGRLDLDHFSNECAGTVIKCGSGVRNLAVGDRVYCLAKGKYGNRMRTPAGFAQKMSADHGFHQAASLPIVFATAIYGLQYLGHLVRNEKVLIQSATGGLGLAAIQVARDVGAEIFATVGSEAKRTFLVENLNFPETHIAVVSSRDPTGSAEPVTFFPEVVFDVVLNTGSGQILEESLRKLNAGGRLIDVGRVDVQNRGFLHMATFQRNASFASFDLNVLMDLSPDVCSRLMRDINDMLQSHRITWLPIKQFDVSELDQALLYFSKGAHTGKVVVTYEDHNSLIKVTAPSSRAAFDPNATYILVGGLGGLGRALISWMMRRGARYFAVITRSGAKTPEQREFIESMTDQGLKIQVVKCDIGIQEEVTIAIKGLSRERVVKGVIHAAMVLVDKLFTSLTFDEWSPGLAAKCCGTVNLHEATIGLPLDFFMMLTSISNHIAHPTQAIYSAANSFQDGFAQYRRRLGLPACAIALGLITEIGDLGQQALVQQSMSRNDLYAIGEYEFLQIVEAAFLTDHESTTSSQTEAYANIVASLEPSRLLQQQLVNQQENPTHNPSSQPRWYTDARFSHIRRSILNLTASRANSSLGSGTKSTNDTSAVQVDQLIRAGKRDDALMLVTKAVINRVADMLFTSAEGIEKGKSVSEYGVDSLIAAELRNWFAVTYGCDISFLMMLDPNVSIEDLAGMVLGAREKDVGQ